MNFGESDYVVLEDEGLLEISLVLDRPADSELSVEIVTFDSSATGMVLN